jgi:hypothetical protein
MPMPFHFDHALAARLEAVQAAQLTGRVEAVAARLPAMGAASLQVAGGVAVFAAPHISVSHAAGLGMAGAVTAADVDAILAFYRSRDTEARVLASPYAHPSLFEQLGDRGFRLAGLDTVLVRPLDPAEPFAEPPAGVTVVAARPDDAAAWVRASTSGFASSTEPASPELAAVFEATFAWPDLRYFFARVDGAVAGTGALFVHGRTALLCGTSSLVAQRGRGAQAALIRARLAAARDAGADLAFSSAEPGDPSHRNLERAGFFPVGSEALLVKRLV